MNSIRATVSVLLAASLIAFAFPHANYSVAAQKNAKQSDHRTKSKPSETAQPTPRNKGDSEAGGFAAYELILERNVFNPNRAPSRRSERDGPTPEPTPAPETVDLLGTWVTERQSVAFIEGTGASLNGAPGVGENVAGWRIAAIDTEKVTLEKEDRKLTWPVGRRLERAQSGEWKLARAAASQSRTSSSSSGSAAKPQAADENAGADDMLKLMRERRQREMTK